MKTTFAVLAVVVALGIGVAIGASLLTSEAETDGPDEKSAEIERLKEENARLADLRKTPATGTTGAEGRAGSPRPASMEPPAPAPAPESDEGAEAGASAVAAPRWFADWKDGALRGVDWEAVGESIHRINPLVVAITDDVKAGRRPDGQTIAAIQEENGTVLKAALSVHEKLGGDDAVEYFSDPVVMANAMATTLEAAGLPLTPAQADALERTARYWTDKLDRLRETWDDSTLKLTRMSEAAGLKERFFEEAFRGLTAEQAEALNPSETRDRIRLTIFSTAHLYAMRTRVIPFTETAEIEAPLFGGVAYELRLSEEERKQAKEVYDDWFAALPPDLLDWPTEILDLRGHPTAQRVTAWAKEEAELLGRIVAALPLTEDQIARARGLGVVGVPVRKPAD